MENQNLKKKRNPFWATCIFLTIIFLIILCVASGVGLAVYIKNGGDPIGLHFNNANNNQSNPDNSNQNDISQYESNETYIAQSDLIKLVEDSQPAVVTVAVKESNPFANKTYQSLESRQTIGSGTGFFISSDGLLITNEHVVCGTTASDLLIVGSNEKTYTVEAVAADSSQDVAILKVNLNGDSIKTLKFANQDSPIKVGTEVVAIGNPFGDNPGSVTRGIISGVGRNVTAQGSCDGQNQLKDYEGVLQTDAAINAGNSGGPLLNMHGEVVGVNSATLTGANNISYTIPFTTVTRVLQSYLKNNGEIISPYLGVSHNIIEKDVASANNVPVGAYVRSVVSNSPADKAGIKSGDIITKLGDYDISFSLTATLNQHFEPGQKTTVTVYRSTESDLSSGKTLVLDITIGQK